MKLSNKILLSIYGFILVTILTFMITLKLNIGDAQAYTREVKRTAKVMSLDAFENIALTGEMYLEIKAGDDYSLTIEGYDEDDRNIGINPVVNNGVLEIDQSGNPDVNYGRSKLLITTPKVKKITLNNNAGISLIGFQLDSLQLNVSLDAVCKLNDVDLNFLSLVTKQNARIRANSSSFRHVLVDLDGESNCDFRDISADLIEGDIKHRSNLRFSGKVGQLNVKLDKAATVRKFD